jgi:hypothetical protein
MKNHQNGNDIWTDRQLPEGDEVFLDHLAHFVPDMTAAEKAMADLGFVLSPFTPQTYATDQTQPPIQVGLANRCALLGRGYLEILTPHGKAETALADQLCKAIERYVGVHLLAFSCADPDVQAKRLTSEGFEPHQPVPLQREIETQNGSGLLRFSVLRVDPQQMPEGRIQFLRHHTPQLLWQDRWTSHPNGAQALSDVLLCVDDPHEVASRFGRFTGANATNEPYCITTQRGRITIVSVDAAERFLDGIHDIQPPFIAAYGVTTTDLNQARQHVVAHGMRPNDYDGDTDNFWVHAPPGLGSAIFFHKNPESCPWRKSF